MKTVLNTLLEMMKNKILHIQNIWGSHASIDKD